MKRRDFFKTTGQAGAAGLALNLFPSLSSALEAEITSDIAPALLTKSWFEQFINGTFWLRIGGLDGIDLELVNIKDGPVAKGLEQFNIIFHALYTRKRLPSGIYSLLDPQGNYIKLHLEPIKGIRGVYYQATFNLLANT